MLSIVFARVIRSRVVSDCQESYWWKTDPTMCACVFGGGGTTSKAILLPLVGFYELVGGWRGGGRVLWEGTRG